MDESTLLDRLRGLEIETPSWGYGNSGTRFHVFPWPGAARSVEERIADAGLVHRLTGCCRAWRCTFPGMPSTTTRRSPDMPPTTACESAPSTRTSSGTTSIASGASATRTRRSVREPGRLPRVHRDRRTSRLDDHQPLARRRDQLRGPGQPARPARAARREPRRALRSAARWHAAADRIQVLRAAFYSTDLPDWGTAALLCRQLGPQAQVLVDTGHHPLGTNVEQIVAVLLGQGLLGGFHFNNRKYADDDLIVGSVDPFELFRIMCEIAWRPTPTASPS